MSVFYSCIKELSKDLWRLKVLLSNWQLDEMRELEQRGLPQNVMAHWDEHFEAFPALDAQRRIFELSKKLWN